MVKIKIAKAIFKVCDCGPTTWQLYLQSNTFYSFYDLYLIPLWVSCFIRPSVLSRYVSISRLYLFVILLWLYLTYAGLFEIWIQHGSIRTLVDAQIFTVHAKFTAWTGPRNEATHTTCHLQWNLVINFSPNPQTWSTLTASDGIPKLFSMMS